MLRQGEGEPLVLLHGVMCSELVWRRVVPLLADDFDVIAPTLLGHRGGSRPGEQPVDFVPKLVDDVERQMDNLGVGRAHVAGNSLGGWVAIELARRDRALSVCALSPAGAWDEETKDYDRSISRLRAARRDNRLGRSLLSLVAHSKLARRWALRPVAAHGERVGPAAFQDASRDVSGCGVEDFYFHYDTQLEPLDPTPCPVTIAWAGEDVIFPVEEFGGLFRDLIPKAKFRVLEGLGHIPMYDDPRLVAGTIRTAASTAADGDE